MKELKGLIVDCREQVKYCEERYKYYEEQLMRLWSSMKYMEVRRYV